MRIFIDGGGEGGTAFLGEDWGKFTPIDDEMKLYLGVAQDIVVKRTIDKNERKRIGGNLFNQEVIVKYEIENFKDQAGDARRRREPAAHPQRSPRRHAAATSSGNWARRRPSPAAPTRRRARSSRSSFHATLPARAKDGKAEKIMHKLHVLIKNEW